MNRKIFLIKEWDFVRVIASLSIVLLHSTTKIARVNGHINHDIYQLLRVLLTASTAVFVLLSIIIIAYIYKHRLPTDFLRKRFKYILLPFFFFAFVYAVYYGLIVEDGNFYNRLLSNFKGGFVGWFIIPIFQLYFIFWVLKKTKLDKNIVVLFLMMIGVYYLILFSTGQTRGLYIDLNMKMLFPIWLVYFGFAYFIGKYYEAFSKLLNKRYSFIVIISLFMLSILLIKYNFDNGNRSVNSRRIDLVPYVVMLSTLLIYIGKKIPHLFIIRYLSKYAFGIYLLHWLLQKILAPHFATLNSTFLQISGLFVVSVIGCIVVINLILLIPYNKFMIGNIKPNPSLLNLLIDKFDYINKGKGSFRF